MIFASPKAPLDCIKGSWRAAPEGIKAINVSLHFAYVRRGGRLCPPIPTAVDSLLYEEGAFGPKLIYQQ